MTIRSFVLRQGRLTQGQEKAFVKFWPVFGIEIEKSDELFDFQGQFDKPQPLILEIGFGNGESLVEMAKNQPENNFLGLEVHTPGVGYALIKIEEAAVDNLRLMRADAVQILTNNIADHSLTRVQIYFSDPWPKAKHHKRRLIQRSFTDLLHRKLVEGGEVHCATDWEDYAYWMREIFQSDDKWKNLGLQTGFSVKPVWRPETKFEKRGLNKGHQVWDLRYVSMNSSDSISTGKN